MLGRLGMWGGAVGAFLEGDQESPDCACELSHREPTFPLSSSIIYYRTRILENQKVKRASSLRTKEGSC